MRLIVELNLFRIFRSWREKMNILRQWCQDAIAVCHIETFEHVLAVMVLIELDCAVTPVAGYVNA